MQSQTEKKLLALLILIVSLGAYSIYFKVVFPLPVYLFSIVCFVAMQIIHLKRGNILSALVVVPNIFVILIGILVYTNPLPSLPRFPQSVLTDNNVSVAFGSILVFSSVFLFVTILGGVRRSWDNVLFTGRGGRKREIRIIWAFIALALLISILTVPGTTILSATYASAEQRTGRILDSAGLKIVGITLLALAITMSASVFGTASRKYKRIVLVILSISGYFYFLRGDRGGSMPIILTLLLLYLMLSKHSIEKKLFKTTSFGIVIFIILVMMSHFRSTAALEGVLPAMGQSWDYAYGIVGANEIEAKHGLLRVPLLPQSFWHALHTADLYDNGISLNGRSFSDLIPQSIPKFISDFLGYERPLNGAWRLGMYRIHGGGIYVVALAHWNFGFFGVVLFSLGLGLIVNFLEKWYRKQVPGVVGTYLAMAGSMPYVMLYGWQPLFKLIEITFFLGLMIKYGVYGGKSRENSLDKLKTQYNKVYI